MLYPVVHLFLVDHCFVRLDLKSFDPFYLIGMLYNIRLLKDTF